MTGETLSVPLLLSSDIDYKERCETIRQVLSTKSDLAILENSVRGGLGHKYISVQYSVMYALILRRQYKSIHSLTLLPSLSSHRILEKHSFLYSTLSQ